MTPAVDILKALVAQVEQLGKSRLQHLNPEYINSYIAFLLKYQDEVDTAAQLEKFGVK
jgi:hypothetical protein